MMMAFQGNRWTLKNTLQRWPLLLMVVSILPALVSGMTPAQLRAQYPQFYKQAVKPDVKSISSQCFQSINQTFFHYPPTEDAVRMIDATGKLGAGILVGNLAWFGSFDECQQLKSAHYCTVAAVITTPGTNKSASLRWGVCVPKNCDQQDIAYAINLLVGIFRINTIKVSASTVFCAHPSPYTFGTIFTLILCGIILSLVVIGTSLELWQLRPKERPLLIYEDANISKGILNEDTPLLNSIAVEKENHFAMEFFLAFSAWKNSIAMFDTKVSPKNVTCVNGMRTLSMFWVILGHTYLWPLIAGTLENVLIGLQQLQLFSFQAVSNAFFCVDSFFFMSGFLVSLLGLREMDKRHGYYPVVVSYIHRFLRLIPAYMFVILFWTNIFPHMSSGPVWYVNQLGNTCYNYWWTNLLFINNFWPTQLAKECLGWSWYLAADMQFFIISPAIIIPLHRFRRKGIILAVLLLAISVGVTAALSAVYNFDASFIENTINLQGVAKDRSDVIYTKPYCRIQPYLVGMILGYLIYEKNYQHVKMSKIVSLLGWMVAIALGLACVYGVKNPLNKFWSATYIATSRLGWGLALSWVVYACHYGYGGLVNTILSWKFWIPLGRLTFTAYLLHPIVLQIFFTGYKSSIYFSTELVVYLYVSMVGLAYLSAYCLSVCVEYPFANLEKLVFDRVFKINRRGS